MKVFDAHSDILADITRRSLNGEREIIRRYHLDSLKKGNICGAILTVWVEPEYSDDCRRRSLEILKCAVKEFLNISDICLVTGYEAFVEAINHGKLAAILGLEGAALLGEDLDTLYVLYQLGIRHASLTWNEENSLATGICGNPARGLTELGRKAVGLMEELGILFDVSHLNERSFWDAAGLVSRPFVATHSNVYRLCPHPRNLKDDQIKAIADSGGVIGINAWPEFVGPGHPDLNDLVAHIEYVADLAGIEHVGLGLDFCNYLQEDTLCSLKTGNSTAVKGMEDASKVQCLIEELENRKYSPSDIEKIACGNFLRVLQGII